MTKYVRLENNIVLETFESDITPSELFHPSLEWVGCGDEFPDIYSAYDGVQFKKPTVDLEQKERSWRNSELQRADIQLNKLQDSDPDKSGTVSAWRAYRVALRAWPQSIDFPILEQRPLAPDAIVQVET